MRVFTDAAGWHCTDRCGQCGTDQQYDAVVRKTGKILPTSEDPENTNKRWHWQLAPDKMIAGTKEGPMEALTDLRCALASTVDAAAQLYHRVPAMHRARMGALGYPPDPATLQQWCALADRYPEDYWLARYVEALAATLSIQQLIGQIEIAITQPAIELAGREEERRNTTPDARS